MTFTNLNAKTRNPEDISRILKGLLFKVALLEKTVAELMVPQPEPEPEP